MSDFPEDTFKKDNLEENLSKNSNAEPQPKSAYELCVLAESEKVHELIAQA
ncbi:hypothetical protein [Psychrobacter sp. DAB_AL62B]|uniref:hypothetical protein n=1 Tax=Psychrobacter sp. DAB_AL62B TaxID=1028420 RepID=UPI0023813C2D|nr:hypothetical protein [Psychrobacter sp. DAB_AL62B]